MLIEFLSKFPNGFWQQINIGSWNVLSTNSITLTNDELNLVIGMYRTSPDGVKHRPPVDWQAFEWGTSL